MPDNIGKFRAKTYDGETVEGYYAQDYSETYERGFIHYLIAFDKFHFPVLKEIDPSTLEYLGQEKEQEGCEYCKDPRTFEGVGATKRHEDRYRVYMSGGNSTPPENERFKRCPFCGRSLKGKD